MNRLFDRYDGGALRGIAMVGQGKSKAPRSLASRMASPDLVAKVGMGSGIRPAGAGRVVRRAKAV